MPSLIPLPAAVEWEGAEHTLTEHSTIGCRAGAGPEETGAVRAARLVLSTTTGLPLPVAEKPDILVGIDTGLPTEGYRLEVRPDGVTIAAADRRGALWAAQTLLQLGGDDVYTAPLGGTVKVATARIEDAPRFAWRGAMIDSARHFLQVAEILDFIDWMARHKLNILHWHLTDDQGWRVASEHYPLLAEKASWRPHTVNLTWGGDGTPHGGCYTISQIAAVAEYARQRGIGIVPEIDLPGHATALFSAYPGIATDPAAVTGVACHPDVFDNVLNFSPEALEFAHGIWSEVLEATGARHAHIGGDEVPTAQWEASEEVKRRAAGFGVDDVTSLQRWFTLRIRDWLLQRGVTPIGWDEVIGDGPVAGMVCQAWRGAERGVKAAEQGMDVIMSPNTHTYFDYYQSDLPGEPYAQPATTTLEQVYGFDPVEGMPPGAAERVLGTQFQLWSEFLPTYRAVQYAAWPRGCALAEVAWSQPEGRDFADFTSRLSGHLKRFDAAGLGHRPLTGPHPWQEGGTGWRCRPPEEQDR